MLPRMIDIARARLPGGKAGEYQIGRDYSLSALVFRTFGISAAEFVHLVGEAITDADVADRLWPAATMPPEALSARLQSITVGDVPPVLKSEFERLYGSDLPADRPVFDVIDANDAAAFNPSV